MVPFCFPGTFRFKSLRRKEWDFEPRTIGDHVRRRRLELGLTQNEVAVKLEVTEHSIINWEKGDWQPNNVFTLHRIVKFLGYDPDQAVPQTLRDRLRQKRQEMGWGQRELAEHLGVNARTVSYWESGNTILKRPHRIAVARFLGIEDGEFVAQMADRWNASHAKRERSVD